jgi:imidazolonepropionase-like amidohydrolase
MTLTVFSNARVLDTLTGRAREGFSVVVEGNRIREVSDRTSGLSGANEIDVGGRTIMPGLIDVHVHVYATHLNQGATRGMPLTLMTTYALQRMKGMLDRGFTTVRDAAGGDFGIRQAVEEGLCVGPRLFIPGKGISMTGGHGDMRHRMDDSDPCDCSSALNALTRIADGPDEVRKAARDELRKGANFIKVFTSGGVGSPNDPLEGRQFSTEEVRAAVDEAAAWNTYVTAHSYTARSTQHAVRNGVKCIEHGNLIDIETAELMAEHAVFMVPTLVCYEESARHGKHLGLSSTVMEKLRRVNEGGIQMLGICKRAGVKMGFGTDLMGELHVAQSREFLIRAQVLSAAEVIASATIVNAEIIGMSKQLGIIEAGALADLLVVDGDPLEDLGLLQDQGQHLTAIMKNGEFHKNLLH